MNDIITAGRFLELAQHLPVIDVRSEKEYFQGHIPAAFNIPLFNNEERAIVGTIYKNSGKDQSVIKGLEIAGPKMSGYIKALKVITTGKEILIHCWRGGLRSENMAWLFYQAGYKVSLLEGGYKAYRHLIREKLSLPAKIIILGGMTGTGKTELLHSISRKGNQVLDLEKLAFHKGSVFGGLGQPEQPTIEQFENNIYAEWKKFDLSLPVWVEDESRMIGIVTIPDPLFEQMSNAPMIEIRRETEERIRRLTYEYSTYIITELQDAVMKISEKLGGTNTKEALAAIQTGDFSKAARISLYYYDKAYAHSLLKRKNKQIIPVKIEGNKQSENANLILDQVKKLEKINTL